MAPNVILINCDDLGYGDLGCYGSTVNRTPHLNRMAEEGLRFTDFYAPSPVCSPSRAAMLTGCYPTRVGFGGQASGGLGGVLFPGWSVGLNPNEITIARLLSDAGYATKLVGKWHCGDQPEFLPTAHGFDEYYGIPYSNDMGRQVPSDNPDRPTDEQVEEMIRDRGCTEPWIRPPLPLLDGDAVLEAQPDQAALTGRYLEQAVRFVRQHRDGPFFLYLAHLYVHLPIYVQERFRKESDNGDYGAAVACIDWVTGVLLAELAALGIDEDTVVMFTSDNGALADHRGGSGSNAPLRGAKGSTWEGGQRVPFLVRWPGRIPAGEERSQVTSAIDLLPTIAGLCDLAVPQDRVLDGTDLRPLLEDKRVSAEPDDDVPDPGGGWDPDREFVYFQGGGPEAIRVGPWKLHVARRGSERQELYHLGRDIGETEDVSEANPEVVADLAARLVRVRDALGDERLGIEGREVREIGRVDDPVPLTVFDPDHPYFMAEYDLPHRG
ncbi:MAG: sulfatase [Actinomycetota bacterium]